MTRILSYNIQTGGYNYRLGSTKRTHQLRTMIRSLQPDVVGPIEPLHPKVTQKPLVIEEIAEREKLPFFQLKLQKVGSYSQIWVKKVR